MDPHHKTPRLQLLLCLTAAVVGVVFLARNCLVINTSNESDHSTNSLDMYGA
jgi:hypothetical protein